MLTITTKEPIAKGQFLRLRLGYAALFTLLNGVVSESPNKTPKRERK